MRPTNNVTSGGGTVIEEIENKNILGLIGSWDLLAIHMPFIDFYRCVGLGLGGEMKKAGCGRESDRAFFFYFCGKIDKRAF